MRRRSFSHWILWPTWWLCRWFPHKDERVPDVVMRGIDRDYDDYGHTSTYLCNRCGRFRTEGGTSTNAV